jgi:hypothetical protein
MPGQSNPRLDIGVWSLAPRAYGALPLTAVELFIMSPRFPRFPPRDSHRLPPQDRIINIHFDPHRTEPRHLLKHRLEVLGWTEDYCRRMHFIH